MAMFAFWNIGKRKIADEIAVLCNENPVDVLILAESPFDEAELLLRLNAGSPARTFTSPFNPSPKLQLYTRYPADHIKPVADAGGLAARLVKPPVGIEVLLIGVHLPSKLYMSGSEQTIHATRVANFVREAELTSGNRHSLLLGDFNMDPFEDGMVAADGLHGVMDQRLARKLSREVQGEIKPFFYNPMWSRLGDTSVGPPGTFYYRGGQISRFWHTFDQALLRPTLLDYYSADGLIIPEQIGSRTLLSGDRIDREISDHLPLLLELQIEKGTVSS